HPPRRHPRRRRQGHDPPRRDPRRHLRVLARLRHHLLGRPDRRPSDHPPLGKVFLHHAGETRTLRALHAPLRRRRHLLRAPPARHPPPHFHPRRHHQHGLRQIQPPH